MKYRASAGIILQQSCQLSVARLTTRHTVDPVYPVECTLYAQRTVAHGVRTELSDRPLKCSTDVTTDRQHRAEGVIKLSTEWNERCLPCYDRR
jgi:hypothetical protein